MSVSNSGSGSSSDSVSGCDSNQSLPIKFSNYYSEPNQLFNEFENKKRIKKDMMPKTAIKKVTMSLFFILSLLISNFHSSNKLALSHITLLLPYTSDYINSPTRFKIQSFGGESNGCVLWSIEPKKGIIEIINFNNNNNNNKCSTLNTFNSAIIKAVSPPENGRVSATITAIDPISKQSAECEVFIDKVNKLQVATSTRLIYLGKYESIEV